jgi:starvation-inducible outer membrane lipoprotein
MKYKAASVMIILCLLITGCATTQQRLLDSDSSQLQLRNIQTRAFDTADKEKTLRTVMSTLQDLGFVIDKADATLGTVSATKLKQYSLRMTVTVRPRGETQVLVRANAQYNIQPVTEPELYQQFFISLEKAMFLTAHQAD